MAFRSNKYCLTWWARGGLGSVNDGYIITLPTSTAQPYIDGVIAVLPRVAAFQIPLMLSHMHV